MRERQAIEDEDGGPRLDIERAAHYLADAAAEATMSSERIRRGVTRDRLGREWSVALVPSHRADEEDFRFWFEELTGEERVVAVRECLLSSLRARGIHEVPRLRRVARRVERRKR